MITKSEELFERLCRQEDWTFSRIERESHKTPDFKIEVNGTAIFIEVKELQQNAGDLEAVRELEETGVYSLAPDIGKRMGTILQKARKQIKKKTQGLHSAVVIFYDNTPLGLNPIHGFDMRRTMCGEHKIRKVQDLTSRRLVWRGEVFGGRRKMTETSNTSISALASIFLQGETVGLNVYHNRFAAIPLSPGALNGSLVRHFRLAEDKSGKFPDWLEVAERERPPNQEHEADG